MAGTERAEDRIRRAAVELMARKGVAGTTTQDIARRAHCSQAAIYKYWDGKETLARELFDGAQTRLIEGMEAGARGVKEGGEPVLGALLGLLLFARSHPADYAFLFHVFHSDYARWLVDHPKPRDVVLRELTAGAAAGRLQPGNPSAKAAMLLGMAIRLAFFERQNLIEGGSAAAEEALWLGAAAVLEN